MMKRALALLLGVSCVAWPGLSNTTLGATQGILQIRNGYFWDPSQNAYFLPRGIAYQVWNPPVGADQSFEQVEYDLTQFKKMHANSVRAEFVWSQVEVADNDPPRWEKTDFLVATAERLGLRLFVIIGFQYPPDWFDQAWYATNDRGTRSDVLNYVDPNARAAYVDYVSKVAARYRNSPAIGAWILGNEYAFFDLWEPKEKYPVHRLLGYDPLSLADFRRFLAEDLYEGDLARLNANWGTTYADFESVPMPLFFPATRDEPAYHDLIQWRKRTIGDFIALGAAACRQADPHHLITYSMVGGVFSAHDYDNTAEDGPTIVERCRVAGAPLDFWSVNNYAAAEAGNEQRIADFGIAKYQAQTGLPVLVSETGHSSTETNLGPLAEAPARQRDALAGQIWESLLSGAIGTHIFTWNDRQQFVQNFFLRERGFGVVTEPRLPKPNDVLASVERMFARMAEINIDHLLGGSSDPAPDVQFYWSVDADVGWPQANHNHLWLWGGLRRLGYQPGLVDDLQFAQGDYTNAPALLVSRAFHMKPENLEALATRVVPAGIHLHADYDLPGQFNPYHQPNPNWSARMSDLFGLDVTDAVPGWESGATNLLHGRIGFSGVSTLGGLGPGYTDQVKVLKIWHGIRPVSGTTVVRHTGFEGRLAGQPVPALQIKSLPAARTAINTFSLGDINVDGLHNKIYRWDFHNRWLDAIYREHFGIVPKIRLSGPGSQYVYPDYRICRDGSILVALLNGDNRPARVAVSAPDLIAGKTVENLTAGGIVERNSDGIVTVDMAPDDYVLLYAYASSPDTDASLVNASPHKLWFVTAPQAVWPPLSDYPVTLGYDLAGTDAQLGLTLERTASPQNAYGSATPISVHGWGQREFNVRLAGPDLADPDYLSTPEGGEYRWHAWLARDGVIVSEAFLPVRLLWGVRPISLPASVQPGSTYNITLHWQELPSHLLSEQGTPLDRARLWESRLLGQEHYRVVLDLLSGDEVVASSSVLTKEGTSSQSFSITAPPNAVPPWSWSARLETAPNVGSHDVVDGFEGRGRGEELRPPLFAPWVGDAYADNETVGAWWLDEGIAGEGSASARSATLVVTNSLDAGLFSGFFLTLKTNEIFALPLDPAQGTNFTIGFDFKELEGLSAELELQIKDVDGHWIQSPTRRYTPGTEGWDSVSFTLDQFVPGQGDFDPAQANEILLNVIMLQKGVQYVGLFDNIAFDLLNLDEGFEGYSPGMQSERPPPPPPRILPWSSYHVSAFANTRWLNEGIQLGGSEGSQSAFLVVRNPPNPGSWAVFGLQFIFDEPWALPSDRSAWKAYSFSADYREEVGLPARLELQVKNEDSQAGQHLLYYPEDYAYEAARDGWHTIGASLDLFEQPAFSQPFDPARVHSIVVNVVMQQTDAAYVGMFDNIRFEGPEVDLGGGDELGSYSSAAPPSGLTVQRDPSGWVGVGWFGGGVLESATALRGDWQPVPSISNPHWVEPGEALRFFRVRRTQ